MYFLLVRQLSADRKINFGFNKNKANYTNITIKIFKKFKMFNNLFIFLGGGSLTFYNVFSNIEFISCKF